ncbi:MAG: hypothetical protein P4L46_25535 [Fimbriimonas sp.]|nr:hypothetical protein [Fimbriimonas sp.]
MGPQSYRHRIQLRVLLTVGMAVALSANAFAADNIVKQVVEAGWENVFFLSAPIIAWLIGSAIYRAKTDQSVSPGEAARSSFWWMLGVFVFIGTSVLLLFIAKDSPWWLWLILIGVALMCFFIGYRKGRR